MAAVESLARAAMGNAPFVFRFFVFSAAVSAILAAALAAGFIFNRQHPLAMATFLFGLVPLFAVTFFLARRFQAALAVDKGANPSWIRAVPRVEEGSTHLEPLSDLLEETRREAREHLKDKVEDIAVQDADVRASVFLPDYRDANEGYAFRLYMPKKLQKQMDFPPEFGIRFRPGEGATGLVFLTASRRITYRRDFLLNDEFKGRVHKDLKAFVSFPLKDPNGGTTLGVLNIDVLQHEIDREILDELASAPVLLARIDQIAQALAKLPRIDVMISWRDASLPALEG